MLIHGQSRLDEELAVAVVGVDHHAVVRRTNRTVLDLPFELVESLTISRESKLLILQNGFGPLHGSLQLASDSRWTVYFLKTE